MVDHSYALIKAILHTYCGKNLNEYLNTTFDMTRINSFAIKDIPKAIVTICFAHFMKLVKKDIEKSKNGEFKKNLKKKEKPEQKLIERQLHLLLMKYMAALVEATSFNRFNALVVIGFILFKSKKMHQIYTWMPFV